MSDRDSLRIMALQMIEALIVNDFVFDDKLIGSIYGYCQYALGDAEYKRNSDGDFVL